MDEKLWSFRCLDQQIPNKGILWQQKKETLITFESVYDPTTAVEYRCVIYDEIYVASYRLRSRIWPWFMPRTTLSVRKKGASERETHTVRANDRFEVWDKVRSWNRTI